jgi:hypothetical protein
MHLDLKSAPLATRRQPTAGLVSGPVVIGDEVKLTIRAEHDGHLEEFRIRMYAPALYEYAPYVESVRNAIARVLAEHEAELETMFARMG